MQERTNESRAARGGVLRYDYTAATIACARRARPCTRTPCIVAVPSAAAAQTAEDSSATRSVACSEAEFPGEHRHSLARKPARWRAGSPVSMRLRRRSATWLSNAVPTAANNRVSLAKVGFGLTVSLTYATRYGLLSAGSGFQVAAPRLWVFSQSSSAETLGLPPRSPSRQTLPARHRKLTKRRLLRPRSSRCPARRSLLLRRPVRRRRWARKRSR